MARWYSKVEEAKLHSFHVIAAAFYEQLWRNIELLHPMAESFNAKIKLLRANLRGVVDKKFSLFRIANLFAYPH